MKIESKYEINDHIWILEIVNKEICIFDDYIEEIGVTENGIEYWIKIAGTSIKENEIVKFEDKNSLYNKIIELTKSEDYKMEG